MFNDTAKTCAISCAVWSGLTLTSTQPAMKVPIGELGWNPNRDSRSRLQAQYLAQIGGRGVSNINYYNTGSHES
jgi:hypothetical protein